LFHDNIVNRLRLSPKEILRQHDLEIEAMSLRRRPTGRRLKP
jgi:hypothetical protein